MTAKPKGCWMCEEGYRRVDGQHFVCDELVECLAPRPALWDAKGWEAYHRAEDESQDVFGEGETKP